MNNEIVIRNLDPQEITIQEGGTITGITNVYVNGTDVTIGTKAYVIVPTKLSELTNDEGFITNAEETDPTVPSYVKAITQADINSWNSKQDQLVNTQNIKSINNQSILGSGNLDIGSEYEAGNGIDISDNIISNTITSYNDLTDTPIIPTRVSELINDSGYITKDVNDLTNYYNIEFLTKLLPMSEDSGTELYLEDTAETPLRIDLNPHEIEQHTTTGVNLFDISLLEATAKNGITLTKNDDGSVTLNGTATADANFDFYITSIESDTSHKLQLYNQGGSFTGNYVSVYIATNNTWSDFNMLSISSNALTQMNLYNKTYTYGRVKVNTGVTCNNLKMGIQIIASGNITTFEEYTGGEPSPNPGYPQILHTITGENTITVCGKNLIESTARTGNILLFNGSSQTDYIFKAGTYTLSYVNPNTTSVYVRTATTSATSLGTNSPRTFTMAEDFNVWIYRSGMADNETTNVQLERGSTATSYEAYQSQEYPINLFNVYNPYSGTTDDFDLVKITTSRDVYETFFFKNYKDSRYYISGASEDTIWYNIGVYKYESNPNDEWYLEELYGGGIQFSLNIPNLYAGGYSKVRSNYFTDITDVNDSDTESCIFALLNTLSVRFNSSYNINTIEDFITWITNNPFTAYIARSGTTPEYQVDRLIDNWADLAVQYKNVMNEATAYNGATNITQDNYDLPYELKGKTFKKIS